MRVFSLLLVLVFALGATGCNKWFWGGAAAAGAAGAGAYEYSNKQKLEDLKDDLEDGKISQEEYERRKHEIEKKSVIY